MGEAEVSFESISSLGMGPSRRDHILRESLQAEISCPGVAIRRRSTGEKARGRCIDANAGMLARGAIPAERDASQPDDGFMFGFLSDRTGWPRTNSGTPEDGRVPRSAREPDF